MSNPIRAIPEGFQTLTPYLVIPDTAAELKFLEQGLGAQTIHVSRLPDGTIMHATLKLGTSMLMMGQSGGPHKPLPAAIYMYVESVDEIYRQALAAGGKSLREPVDEFYGDRVAGVEDTNGVSWWMATHVEDVSDEELERRAQAARTAG